MSSTAVSPIFAFSRKGKSVFQGSLEAFFSEFPETEYMNDYSTPEELFGKAAFFSNYRRVRVPTTHAFSLDGKVRVKKATFKAFVSSWALGADQVYTFKSARGGVQVFRDGQDAGVFPTWAEVFLEFCRPKGWKVDASYFVAYGKRGVLKAGVDLAASYPWCEGYAEAKVKADAKADDFEETPEPVPEDKVEEVAPTEAKVEEVTKVEAPRIDLTPVAPTKGPGLVVLVVPTILQALRIHLANDPLGLKLLEAYELASG